MTRIPETHQGIVEKSQFMILGTTGPHLDPQVSTLLFLFEGDELTFSIGSSRQQFKNLQINPRVSAFFVDSENARRTVELRGTVRIDPDPDYLYGNKVGSKYGYDLRELDGPLEVRHKVTVNIEDVHTFG